MTDAAEFVPLSAQEVQRLRAPGRRQRDSLGVVTFEPLAHETKVRIQQQAAGVRPTDLYLAADGGCVLERPPVGMDRATRRYAEGPVHALARLSAASAREYVAQQNAIDTPFQEMARERFARAGALLVGGESDGASAASDGALAAALTELDPFKTKQTTGREVVEIDTYGSRCRRLKKSVQNSAHLLDAHAHTQDTWQRWRRLFVTLTYRSVDDWRASHVRSFTDAVRKWFLRKCNKTRLRLVWVLELQKRGAVHYHCMIWVRSRDFFPNPAKVGWWPHGFAHVLSSKVQINRPVAYMAKYCSKVTTEQAMSVPKGARMHGVCGLDQEGKRVVRFWRAPLFVRDHFGGKADIRKAQGGYMNKLDGEFLHSPWHVSILPSGRVFAWRDIPPQLAGVNS